MENLVEKCEFLHCIIKLMTQKEQKYLDRGMALFVGHTRYDIQG